MGRRALIIALASFLVIAVGTAITLAILASGTPTAAPSPSPTTPIVDPVEPVDTPTPTPTATEPAETPTPAPTGAPADPPPAPVTALAAKPAPHSVRLDWKNPADADLLQVVIVQAAGKTPPAEIAAGTVVAKLPAGQTTFTDTSAALVPGKPFSYSVFARDEALTFSTASAVTVTLPVALAVTPIDVTGDLTQQAADATLVETGSLAFTAFNPKGTRIAAVLPAAGVTGTLTRIVTEPAGAAPGTVAWTYKVPNASLRSLAEGAKRDEVFVIELRDGKDKLRTTVTISLHGINDAPVVAAAMPGQAGIAGQPFAFPIPPGTFTDVDATDTLTLSAGTLPGWLSFSGGQLTGNPGAGDTGSTTVSITATDPHGATASADVVIDVATPLPTPNQPPVPAADAVTFDLGADPLQTTANVLANDADPDGGPNALAAVPASGEWMVNGLLAGSYTLDAAGTLHLDSGIDAAGPLQTLGAGETATATISYSATDGLDTVPSSIGITVIAPLTKGGEYGVTKALAPGALASGPSEARGRGLGH